MANETIIDFVMSRAELRAILDDLLEHRYLLPGIFQPRAYLRDVEQIVAAWRRQKSKINAIAMGVSIYNDFHSEIVNDALAGKDPHASAKTCKSLEKWKVEIVKHFPSDNEAIESICATLGQYLEYANRKSQGF